MTAIHWLSAINGSFTNVADWSGGAVPAASDDAILDAVGSAFTVTSSMSETVASLQLASNATLSVTSGAFTASNGTGSGSNAGVILVAGGATLAGAGQITNAGTIAVGGRLRGASLALNGDMTLTGGGQVELQGTGANHINAKGRFAELINVDNTISGSGAIGSHNDKFFLVNDAAGVIDAIAANPLVIESNLENHGLMEATGAGGLTISGLFEQNDNAGIVLAANGSVVRFEGSRVKQGTLNSQGSGVLIGYNSYFQTCTNNAHLMMNGYTVLVEGIKNNGSISLNGEGVLSESFTLTGGGIVNLGTAGSIYEHHYGVTFDNVSNTIEGSGFISGAASNPLTIVNGLHGGIDGNGSYEFRLSSGGATMTNAGTVESTGVNGLAVWAPLNNSGLLVASAGTLSLGRADAAYNVMNTGTISAAGGTIVANVKIFGSGQAAISAGTLVFTSAFNETVSFTGSSGILELARSQDYSKTITGFANNGGTILDLDDIGFVGTSEASFSGTTKGGVLTVTDGTSTATINLKGNYLTSTFIASSDGHGGTDVVATSLQNPSAAHFVSAMATMIGRGATTGLTDARTITEERQMMLTAPRLAIA